MPTLYCQTTLHQRIGLILGCNVGGKLHLKEYDNAWSEKPTCAWTRLFLAMMLPDCIGVFGGSEQVRASLLWNPWWLTWAFKSSFLFCKLPGHDALSGVRELGRKRLLALSIGEGHNFCAAGSSKSMRSFMEYLSFVRYNSNLCLSTAPISSLMYCRSVWICWEGEDMINKINKHLFCLSRRS